MQTRKEARAAVSILPPGDILLEVTRAADPEAVAAAHARLKAQAVGRSDTFDVPATQAKTARADTKPPEHFVQFEAMVLQTFLKSMLPEETGAHYGKGLAGEMWRDLLADALGMALAERGGIGIAEQVLGSRGAELAGGQAASEVDMATALVQEIERKMAKRLDGEDDPAARKPS
nr:rod-binding protein [Chelativorans petroleitrophicus]